MPRTTRSAFLPHPRARSGTIALYYLVPERLTPGFEKRLSGTSLATIFGVLALSLPLRGLIRNARKEWA